MSDVRAIFRRLKRAAVRRNPSVMIAIVALFLVFTTGASFGSNSRNDLHSCRATYFHENPLSKPPLREYVIIVDRTVNLDPPLQKDIVDRAVQAIRPGDEIVIASFSGLTETEYTTEIFQGVLDRNVSERELRTEVPALLISSVKQCFDKEPRQARERVKETLDGLLGNPLTKAKQSEIIAALTEISRTFLSENKKSKKTVLIVSDMLENSSMISFYAKRRISSIDPDAIFHLADQKGLVGDFGGAKIYVAGAATVPPGGPTRTMEDRLMLRRFWVEWFKHSHAQVSAWGEPDLLTDIN